MTNLQLLLTIGVPSVLVMMGILLNHREMSTFRDDINRHIDRVDQRLILIKSDQKQFFSVTGKLDGRIDQLSRG